MNRNKRKAPRESFADMLGGKANCFAMVIFAAIVLTVGIAWIEIEARRAEANAYIDSWPITINRNIELTWAGKGAGR